jgi:oxygen-dependent protoporphyrinogen oxidase
METVDVAVVGAGVSGLTAAYQLHKQKCSVVVLERSPRAGGVIQTDHVGDFVIDAGPDSLLAQKPAAIALCKELGLGDRLVSTKQPRTAFVLRGGRLHPLPAASILGFPTRVKPLMSSRLFSPSAKLRMALELVIPKRPLRPNGPAGLAREQAEDESIAQFVRRRFGQEAVTYIAEPLLAGIHAGDVERLSMRALFPRLVDAEARAGSVIRAFRRERAPATADGAFRSFPTGLAELVDALMKAVPNESVHFGAQVSRIDRTDRGFTLHVDGSAPVTARAIILAVPAFVAADLLRPVDSEASALCGRIRYLSTATVVFAFPRDGIAHDLRGTGFVVPRAEGISITAAAWISSKWPQRAPEGYAMVRAFLGGARDPDLLAKSDQDLTKAALDDLTKILGIHAFPTLTRVYRWDRSSPQQEVGHDQLMAKIDARLEQHPGLFISAAGFRGVGIPDCVADARATAGLAATFVRS